MKYIDKDELIKFLTVRIESLQDYIDRDYGSGLSDYLGRYREAKLLKKFVESGKFDKENN